MISPVHFRTRPHLLEGTDPRAIRIAAETLLAGGLVAVPTETVYGLGADARNAAAVERVFAVKGRPADNPLIVHVPDAAAAEGVARMTPLARRLAARWWPGPLTLVLDALPGLPEITTAGLTTVAVRVPDHPVALELLLAAAVPVAAPSANRSGRPSPTIAEHVVGDLGQAVDVVLDGGACRVGVESTVVDARGDFPLVLREGAVTREQLGGEAPAGPHRRPTGAADGAQARSPGTRHRHYAPACRVVLQPPGTAAREAARLARSGRRVGILAWDADGHGVPGHAPAAVEELGRFHDVEQLATMLYGALRRADERGVDVCIVETVEDTGLGRAVMDRLRRAAEGSGAAGHDRAG